MSRDTDFAQMYLDRREEEELHRRKIEELKMKGLDEQTAHMGEERIQLDEVLEFWMWYYIVGTMDPPNPDMQLQGEFKVDRLYSTLSRFAASADVYSDPHRQRDWKVLVEKGGLVTGGLQGAATKAAQADEYDRT